MLPLGGRRLTATGVPFEARPSASVILLDARITLSLECISDADDPRGAKLPMTGAFAL